MRIARHNLVRDHIYDMLKTVFPTASELRCERFIGGLEDGIVFDDGRPRARADIFLRLADGQVIVLDIVIANPSAVRHLARASDVTVEAAALESESYKRAAIADLGLGALQFRFVPFAIETTGRLGPSARAFLGEFIGDGFRDTSRLCCARISSTIARWNARMVLKMRAETGRGTVALQAGLPDAG
jgi:hypothetical protein